MKPRQDDQIDQVQQAIAELEARRASLGDEIMETSLAPLRARLEDLWCNARQPKRQPRPPKSLSLALTEENLRVAYVTTTLSAALPTILFTPTSILASNIPAVITTTASPTLIEILTLTPTPSATRCPVPAGWSKITVKNGDTLASLAETYQTTPAALSQANCLLTDSLIPGTELSALGLSPTQPPTPCGPPPGWIFYTVQKGDNLFRISQAYGITVNELMFANCLVSDLIRVGQTLYVPNVSTMTPSPTSQPRATRTPTPTEIPATPTDTVEVPTETFNPTPTETPGTPDP